MKDKPVIVSINMTNPMVVSEFEKEVDAILVNFGVQTQAILDIVSGNVNPNGLYYHLICPKIWKLLKISLKMLHTILFAI